MTTVFSLVLIALAAGSPRFEAANGAVRDTKTSLRVVAEGQRRRRRLQGRQGVLRRADPGGPRRLAPAHHRRARRHLRRERRFAADLPLPRQALSPAHGLRVRAHRAGDLELVDALREPRRGLELLLQLGTPARHRADGDQLPARALRPERVARRASRTAHALRRHVVEHLLVLDDRPDDVGEEPLVLGVHLIGLERRLVGEVHHQRERVRASSRRLRPTAGCARRESGPAPRAPAPGTAPRARDRDRRAVGSERRD